MMRPAHGEPIYGGPWLDQSEVVEGAQSGASINDDRPGRIATAQEKE
jgi:hypothetical protein